ncbi:hypothetical protein [uncultured Slackia sp.]|uniref:hypothetical protein n=1 Tax=uncultured Slackia sp. TaxID=665903 RepID=UPI0025DCCE2C|nr:hypothetical protein [uncultured Slackia sp.]
MIGRPEMTRKNYAVVTYVFRKRGSEQDFSEVERQRAEAASGIAPPANAHTKTLQSA